MKKLLVKTSAITIGIAASFTIINSGSNVFAASIQDLQSKKENIEENQSKVESGINKAQQELNNIKSQQSNISSEIKRLDMLISDINQKIRDKNNEITTTKANIKKLNEEIKELQDRITKREELLKERAKLYQETGNISYLDVLMGAQSFSDFLDRVGAVTTIVQADQDLIRQHLEDKKVLEKKENEVKEKLEKLQQFVNEQKKMKNELDLQKKEKDKLMETLKSEEETVENEKLNLEEEKSLLTAQKSAIEKAIKLENSKKTEAEKSAPTVTQNNDEQSSSSISNNNTEKTATQSSSTKSSSSIPNEKSSTSSGVWTKPAEGRLTSTLGERWNKFHAGIDIANGSDVPIVAAADGVVSRSYYSSSYGNVVFISHSINGQVYTTVYAHMDSRTVQAGQTVSKGQQVGIMGNTGESYGQHLHFELHKGEWNAAKSNAINPLEYISI